MNKSLKKFILLLGTAGVVVFGLAVFTFFDAFYGGNNFRTMQDEIASTEKVDLRGLRDFQASGGNAPRFMDLQRRLAHIKKDKTIIDVKCEPHGYINGIPTTFLGYGLPQPGFRHVPRRLLLTGTIKERPDLIISEQEEAKKYGFDYETINIGSSFVSTDENIDNTVALLDKYTSNNEKWVHVHCTNGKGRTTIVLTMLDILKNAPTVSLDAIIERQRLLGSVDLYDTTDWKRDSTYTKKQLQDRKDFIKNFYTFVCQRKAGGIQTWTEWRALQ